MKIILNIALFMLINSFIYSENIIPQEILFNYLDNEFYINVKNEDEEIEGNVISIEYNNYDINNGEKVLNTHSGDKEVYYDKRGNIIRKVIWDDGEPYKINYTYYPDIDVYLANEQNSITIEKKHDYLQLNIRNGVKDQLVQITFFDGKNQFWIYKYINENSIEKSSCRITMNNGKIYSKILYKNNSSIDINNFKNFLEQDVMYKYIYKNNLLLEKDIIYKDSKVIFQYHYNESNLKDFIIETNYNGNLNYKKTESVKYSYDKIGNWIEKEIYDVHENNLILSRIIDRKISYSKLPHD